MHSAAQVRLIEFAWATAAHVMGLGLLQCDAAAPEQFDHTAFMTARAGAVGNASPGACRTLCARWCLPTGAGRNAEELAQSYVKAAADLVAHSIGCSTPRSFDDWNDAHGSRWAGPAGRSQRQPGAENPAESEPVGPGIRTPISSSCASRGATNQCPDGAHKITCRKWTRVPMGSVGADQ
jgi:hypothetical protein